MVFKATFNNISVIPWWSVLLVEETGAPRGKPLTCRKSDKLYRVGGIQTHNVSGDRH